MSCFKRLSTTTTCIKTGALTALLQITTDQEKEMDSNNKFNKRYVSFDNILQDLGEFGRYQKRIYFILFIPTIFSAMQKLSWVFLGAKAEHRCKLPYEEDTWSAFSDISFNDSCTYYNDNHTKGISTFSVVWFGNAN